MDTPVIRCTNHPLTIPLARMPKVPRQWFLVCFTNFYKPRCKISDVVGIDRLLRNTCQSDHNSTNLAALSCCCRLSQVTGAPDLPHLPWKAGCFCKSLWTSGVTFLILQYRTATFLSMGTWKLGYFWGGIIYTFRHFPWTSKPRFLDWQTSKKDINKGEF